VKLLVDTHLVLWAAGQLSWLSAVARRLLSDPGNELLFSAASIWEIGVENTLGREDFKIEPRLLRRGLVDNGWTELPITSQHAVGIDALPQLHKDPFDRLLLAQALSEGVTLLTSDANLARYGSPVRKV
jgi:PIN domain nuclease of toxin-antitoxin system